MIKQVKIAAILSSVALSALGTPAHAQVSAVDKQIREFDVPAEPLAQAVLAFSQQAGIQLVLESGTAQGMNSSALKGRMSVEEAVTRLLAGTPLTWRFVNDRTITIEAAPQQNNGERVLGAVRVEGEQRSPYFGGAGQIAGVNGINGSRDITATEGTKSFTTGAVTIGSKVPQAMKDVPQSLSVLTSEQLQQQNITDFNGAMRQLPGVTLVQGTTNLDNTFYSRGFAITSIAVDGGAPLTTTLNFFPQIDMSVYDHVELLRGADGLFSGYGDPSGTVNLVRKKPLDHQQLTIEGQAGSWSNYRLVADATAPLGFDGRLRGRLVMTWQDNHHFYRIAKDNKELIYGIAEFDLTPTTLLTAGIDYTQQNSVPWLGGLPRFQTGADLKLPRSESLMFPWNRWDFTTREFFGGVEQKIGADWTLKVNLTQNRQQDTQKIGYNNTAVNPLNNSGTYVQSVYEHFASDQFSTETVLSGSFNLFGQRQEVTIGGNRVISDAGGQQIYRPPIFAFGPTGYQPYPSGPIYCAVGACPAGSVPLLGPPINVFAFNPDDAIYTEPPNPLPTTRLLVNRNISSGAYVSLRLTAFDRLHLTTGLRWSYYGSEVSLVRLCASIPTTGTPGPNNCVGRQIGDAILPQERHFSGHNFSWPPPANLSFDVTRQLTAYAGYTDIYQSNASFLDRNHNALPPTTGSNWEAGLKWAARGGKFNLSAAAYIIKKHNFPLEDPSVPFQQITPGTACCFLINASNETYKAQGFDLGATGEFLPGWQVAASYTYSENKQEGNFFGTSQGLPFTSIQPKHLYKLWTSYDFGAARKAGWLSGLTLSAGVNGQSSAFYSGMVCVNLLAPDPVTGASQCVSFRPPNFVPYSFTVAPYKVFSARIDYRFTKTWSLAVNIDNIFDKTYYQTVGPGVTGGNWYGPPRSFTATLRAKW